MDAALKCIVAYNDFQDFFQLFCSSLQYCIRIIFHFVGNIYLDEIVIKSLHGKFIANKSCNCSLRVYDCKSNSTKNEQRSNAKRIPECLVDVVITTFAISAKRRVRFLDRPNRTMGCQYFGTVAMLLRSYVAQQALSQELGPATRYTFWLKTANKKFLSQAKM